MYMNRSFFLVAAGLAAFAVPAGDALAARSYDSCTGFISSLPATISTPGTWCLRKDLSTAAASGVAIHIAANNVTIDCNDFKIGGLQAGTATDAEGIVSSQRQNVVVRNCAIRGFLNGIRLQSVPGSLIENNRFEANTWNAIILSGEGSTVRGNQILDTGGSTLTNELATGISVYGNADILDNTITGVVAGATAAGIHMTSSSYSLARGNRVAGLVAETVYGIYSVNAETVSLRDNVVTHTGGQGVGLQCESYISRALHNTVNGFDTPMVNCRDDGNSL